jgi:hypothetical protein
METKILPDFPKYSCDICEIKTDSKKDFRKHLLTAKHKKKMQVNNKLTKEIEDNIDDNVDDKCSFTCRMCKKKYKSRVGLWKHKKGCIEIKDNEDSDESEDQYNEPTDKELLMMVIKENSELKNMMMKVIENGTTNNSHNTNNTNNNTNCHNKQFNLNFFLNETCKNALNMSEFIDLIKPTLEDLENTGRKGYVEGITDLIMKTLKALEQCKRPIHCSDLKRSVLYVKDNDKWEKETEDKPILTNAIKYIAYENIKKIGDWKNKYPDCTQADSRKNDLYLKIVSNAMSGLSEEECSKNVHKIIANLVKETTIQKDV